MCVYVYVFTHMLASACQLKKSIRSPDPRVKDSFDPSDVDAGELNSAILEEQ